MYDYNLKVNDITQLNWKRKYGPIFWTEEGHVPDPEVKKAKIIEEANAPIAKFELSTNILNAMKVD